MGALGRLAVGVLPVATSGLSKPWTPRAVDLAESTYAATQVVEGAIASASEARAVFDDRMAAPRESHPDRFFWDPWFVTHRQSDSPNSGKQRRSSSSADPQEQGDAHLASLSSVDEALSYAREELHDPGRTRDSAKAPGPLSSVPDAGSGVQYNMLRCPAMGYLPKEIFDRICEELSEFGQKQLGCDAFTPPWLALYTDGHEMAWHTDAPHGPWAFVLSLTLDGSHARAEATTPAFFEGGETLLLKPHILDYWRDFDPGRGLESEDIIERIDPTPFGRIVIFDGRIPHAVAPVRGTRDPRRGRLVLTGWYSQPRPRCDGGLAADDGTPSSDALAAVAEATEKAYEALEELDIGRVVGYLAVRLSINPGGIVEDVEALCDTLRVDPAETTDPVEDGFDTADGGIRTVLKAAFLEAHFPAAGSPSTLTIPFSFG